MKIIFNIYGKLYLSVAVPWWRNNKVVSFGMTQIGVLSEAWRLTWQEALAGTTRRQRAPKQTATHLTPPPDPEGRALSTMQGFVSKRLQPPPFFRPNLFPLSQRLLLRLGIPRSLLASGTLEAHWELCWSIEASISLPNSELLTQLRVIVMAIAYTWILRAICPGF